MSYIYISYYLGYLGDSYPIYHKNPHPLRSVSARIGIVAGAGKRGGKPCTGTSLGRDAGLFLWAPKRMESGISKGFMVIFHADWDFGVM